MPEIWLKQENQKSCGTKWGKFAVDVAQTKNLFSLTIRLVQLSLH